MIAASGVLGSRRGVIHPLVLDFPTPERGSVGVRCRPVVMGVDARFRRIPGCVGGGRLSACRMGGGVEDALCGKRFFFARSCNLAELCDQGRLNLGNIPVERVEEAALHQAAYYTIAPPVTIGLVSHTGIMWYAEWDQRSSYTGWPPDGSHGPNGNFHNQTLHFRWIALPRRQIKPPIDKPEPTVSNVHGVHVTRSLWSAY